MLGRPAEMIATALITNHGEIALLIVSRAAELGVRTVAVCTREMTSS